MKRGAINKAFKQRWFVLEDGALFYSKDPSTEVLGAIVLSGAQVSMHEIKGEWEVHIQVMSGRTYVLQGVPPNPRSGLESWLGAIEKAMANGNKGD